LVEQLTSPVRWSDSMRWSIDNVESNFVELAPGKVLSGLMRRIDRGIKVRNFSEPS
jgi:[acyl-carrier-protein] S-malonyltransferase